VGAGAVVVCATVVVVLCDPLEQAAVRASITPHTTEARDICNDHAPQARDRTTTAAIVRL